MQTASSRIRYPSRCVNVLDIFHIVVKILKTMRNGSWKWCGGGGVVSMLENTSYHHLLVKSHLI